MGDCWAYEVQGLWLRVSDLGRRVYGLEFRARVSGSWCGFAGLLLLLLLIRA